MADPKRTRNTHKRQRILRAIQAAGCHLTAGEIRRRVGRDGLAIGLATVYRALAAFARAGLVESVSLGGRATRYGLAAEHHDHVVCLECGRWQPLRRCPAPRAPRDAAPGFRVTGHRLEFFGYCGECR
ncbi:MAG: transcriptional repressor [Armatimonadetes bacterium]|nr:transcriptional repressor [Armatimonadota bacterium]